MLFMRHALCRWVPAERFSSSRDQECMHLCY
jgi:hypothetical protein